MLIPWTGARRWTALIPLESMPTSSGGEGATLLHAGPSPARAGAPRVWSPRQSRYSVGAEQWRGGRNAAPRRAEPGSCRGPVCVGTTAITLPGWRRAAEGRAQRRSRRAEPGDGRGPTCVGATAVMLLDWCRAAEGRAQRRSPPGRIWLGPGFHVRVCHGHHATCLRGWCRAAVRRAQCHSQPGRARLGPESHVCERNGSQATRLVPSSSGEGVTPLPAGLSPDRAGAPRVWAPQPSRCSFGAEQQRGERNATPRRAQPGLGRGPTCVGATAITLPGWCRAAEVRA